MKRDGVAKLTKAETYQLCKGIADQDFYGWLTHKVLYSKQA